MTNADAAFPADDVLLDRNEIRKRFPHLPSSPTYLRKLVTEGKFPAPIAISSRRRVWRLSAIVAYLRAKEAEGLHGGGK